jgi:hypothetical protein
MKVLIPIMISLLVVECVSGSKVIPRNSKAGEDLLEDRQLLL